VTATHAGLAVAVHAAEPAGTQASTAALAADWLTAYTDYLKRAADESAKTVELYQRVTDHIVGGELAPTAAQDMLAAFLQTRGTTYSDQLAQLTMRFFSEMVRISTAYGQKLGQAILPEATVPSVSPPVFDPSDPARWFQQLNDYSQRLSASIAAGYQALLDRAAADGVTPSQIQDAAAGHLQRGLPEYMGELSRLYFDLLNGLTDLRARSEQEFLRRVLENAQGTNATQPFELTLAAPLGGTATASLSIANTRDEPARITCHVTDVRRIDGVGPAIVPDMTFVPERLELAPAEETKLVLTLRLDEGRYDTNALYTGTLQITDHGEPRMEVPLHITATEPVATPAP
jgi:hypothetical protein